MENILYEQTNELPSYDYSCPNCDRKFTTAAGVKRHSHKCDPNLRALEEAIDEMDQKTDSMSTKCFCCGEDLECYHASGSFECSVPGCGMKFKKNISLKKHRYVVHKISCFEFGSTSESFFFGWNECTQSEVCFCCNEKLDTAHVTGLYVCHECGKKFIEKLSISKHMSVVHSSRDFNCHECLAQCPDESTLKRHGETHTSNKLYSCTLCNLKFSSKKYLRYHQMQNTSNEKSSAQVSVNEDKPFLCEFCPRRCPTSGALRKHRRTHTGERPYECETCYKRFGAKETLNRHVRIHTGFKPHCCPICDKKFVQHNQLKSHLLFHSGKSASEKAKHGCEICGKRFSRKTRLNEHAKYVHLGFTPFECSICNKTFIRKEDLNRHFNVHTGVKAHKCSICNKCFSTKSSLKTHMLTHARNQELS